MSDRNTSEERSIPATPRKLREARKRGQVARSRDLPMAAGMIAAVLYLWLAWQPIKEQLEVLITRAAELAMQPLREAFPILAAAGIEALVRVAAPLFAVVLLAVIIGGFVATGGPVFAVEPIKPNLAKLNPIEGLKRLFSLKNLIGLVKSIGQTAVLAAAVTGIVWLGLDALVKSPVCGVPCVGAIFAAIVRPFAVSAIGIFIAFALVDFGAQHRLFLRDMRMTKTERKRERKDLFCDPLIRGERRRRYRELAEGPPLGIRHASLVVRDGSDLAIGLYYASGQGVAPMVVCKGTGAEARALLATAAQRDIPIDEDRELAQAFATRAGLGEYIPKALFEPTIKMLQRIELF